jgi:hypothetical protein
MGALFRRQLSPRAPRAPTLTVAVGDYTDFSSAARNSAHKLAFASHHNEESTMDTSDGTPGAGETPAESARRIKDSASTVMERGKEAAATAVEQGAGRARETADNAVSALRRAADDVEPDNSWIGAALRKSAEGIERASASLNGGDISSALDDLNGFARRNPAIVLGASFALGFALARVGKTAIERVSDGTGEQADGYSPMPGL